MSREAMKLALEALEEVTDVFLDTEGRYGDYELRAIDQANKAAHALRKAIEEGEKQEPMGEAWDKGYRQGVQDERTSEGNIGIAGFGAKVEPARQNPYGTAAPKKEWAG